MTPREKHSLTLLGRAILKREIMRAQHVSLSTGMRVHSRKTRSPRRLLFIAPGSKAARQHRRQLRQPAFEIAARQQDTYRICVCIVSCRCRQSLFENRNRFVVACVDVCKTHVYCTHERVHFVDKSKAHYANRAVQRARAHFVTHTLSPSVEQHAGAAASSRPPYDMNVTAELCQPTVCSSILCPEARLASFALWMNTEHVRAMRRRTHRAPTVQRQSKAEQTVDVNTNRGANMEHRAPVECTAKYVESTFVLCIVRIAE